MAPILLAICFGGLGASNDDSNFALPRYRFTAGREMTWQEETTIKTGIGDCSSEQRDKITWRAWVIRAHVDGSAGVLIQCVGDRTFTKKGILYTDPTFTHVAYADVFPDGRLASKIPVDAKDCVANILPRLPKDANEARDGWEQLTDEGKFTFRSAGPNQFAATTSYLAQGNSSVQLARKTNYSFNPAKGLVNRAQLSYTATSAAAANKDAQGEGTGQTELTEDKILSREQLARLGADVDRFIAIERSYEPRMIAAWKLSPSDAKAAADKARQTLESANNATSHPGIKASLIKRIAGHATISKLIVTQAEKWAQMVDKPVQDLDARDLDGKPVRLADLRGRVVVLDFWYCGCLECTKSMPQVKQLAADFAGQPVTILGVNVDDSDQETRAFAQKMKLDYPILRIDAAQAEKFGFQTFPALIIVDKAGMVRDMHLGYSSDMRETLGKTIQKLAN